MEFSQIKAITIPEGTAVKITFDGKQLWEPNKYIYVSLGDSIAAGHNIDSNWKSNYGTKSQYGANGNTRTTIVPNTYTHLIQQELINKHGADLTETISFATSGDQVHHLINKLDHDAVKEHLKKADLVTICIGANNILAPAMETYLEKYIDTGDLSEFDNTINDNLSVLAAKRSDTTNKYPVGSYGLLFDTLYNLNKKATYVLTTVYNPYKYLWIEEGTNGFFAPLLNNFIPDWNVGIPGTSLQAPMGEWIRAGLLQTPAIQKLFNRVNGLGDWVDSRIERLNQVIRDSVSEYNAYRQGQSNFKVAETKQKFDTYPDRPISAYVNYNDLVNVEYTRGYDVSKMDWGRLWVGKDATIFWSSLALKYTTFKNGFPSANPADYVEFDINGLAEDFVEQMIEKVIVPDVDPHPKDDGHTVLKEVFSAQMDR